MNDMMSKVTTKEIEDNKYKGWINIYNSKAMNAAIDNVTGVANNLYKKAGNCEKRKMHEFFKKGMELELLFWDEMYYSDTLVGSY